MSYEGNYTDYQSENHDRFRSWRESDDIGYVYLAFAVLIEGIKDLFYGNAKLYEDACHFWHRGEYIDEETLISRWSSCDLWLSVLGMSDIPDIVADEIHGRRDHATDWKFQLEVERYLNRLEHIYNLMKVDYYGIIAEKEAAKAKHTVKATHTNHKA
jgi:hypothetical protein